MTKPAADQRGTLLIVDDEPQVCDTLRRVLRRDGFHVLTANSAADALATLENNAVDVIISDQRMPRESGVSLLGKVRERWPDVIRFLLSGAADADEVDRAVADGTVQLFLSKPVPGSELRRHLVAALGSRSAPDPSP
jgi:response regulator RpfG family c-di-GMP phosphodiesterase